MPVGLHARRRLNKGRTCMNRISVFSSPYLLGFGEVERLLERATKSAGDAYPPYNIEKLNGHDAKDERLRITLAVAGFARNDLTIELEDRQLTIRGRVNDETARDYLHRGIAGRQFQRSFVLADGMEVLDAMLAHGMLTINLVRPEPTGVLKRIEIKE
jgi:HSP20 family molecular chaperone IbpA